MILLSIGCSFEGKKSYWFIIYLWLKEWIVKRNNVNDYGSCIHEPVTWGELVECDKENFQFTNFRGRIGFVSGCFLIGQYGQFDQAVLKWNARELVLASMALLTDQSPSVLSLRSAKARMFESYDGKKCTCAPWTFPFKLARTSSFGRPERANGKRLQLIMILHSKLVYSSKMFTTI